MTDSKILILRFILASEMIQKKSKNNRYIQPKFINAR